MWVYITNEENGFTVGFFDPKGKWHTDSDHIERADAQHRVNILNGGKANRAFFAES